METDRALAQITGIARAWREMGTDPVYGTSYEQLIAALEKIESVAYEALPHLRPKVSA